MIYKKSKRRFILFLKATNIITSNLFVNAVTYPFCASPGSHSLKWTEVPELPLEETVELISTNRKLLNLSSAYLWWAVLRKRSTCLHNKLNTFAKGSQKASSMPLGLEIKGRRQARLKLAESNLDRVSCTDLSDTAVCETDAWSVFKANLPSRLHCPPFSCVHTTIALLNGCKWAEQCYEWHRLLRNVCNYV